MYTAKDWIKSSIKSKKDLISAHLKDIERAANRIEEAEKEIAQYEMDLKKFE